MSFLEPVIASILGAAVTALAGVPEEEPDRKSHPEVWPVVVQKPTTSSTLFSIRTWVSGTAPKVDKAFETAIESVSDGELSSDEIKKLAVHMAQAWLPGAAAEKVHVSWKQSGMPAEQRKAAEEITAKVNTAP